MTTKWGTCTNDLNFSFESISLPYDMAIESCAKRGGSIVFPTTRYELDSLLEFSKRNQLNDTLLGINNLVKDDPEFQLLKMNGITVKENLEPQECWQLSITNEEIESIACSEPVSFVCQHSCNSTLSYNINGCFNDKQLFYSDSVYQDNLETTCKHLHPKGLPVKSSMKKNLRISNENKNNIQSICEAPCFLSEVESRNVIVDDCRDHMEYLFDPSPLTYEEAEAFCESFDARLAIPTSRQRLSAMNFAFSHTIADEVWVGLSDKEDIGGEGNAFRFKGSNNQGNGLTRIPFQFPWARGEPNDLNGEENCVVLDEEGLLHDQKCSEKYAALCERYCGIQPRYIFDECKENIQLYFSSEKANFDEAWADCQSVDISGTLAIPKDIATFNRMIDFYLENRPNSDQAHVGLQDFINVGGGSNAERFITTQGESLEFTSIRGRLPWNSGEPDDRDGRENCAEIGGSNGFLNDDPCSDSDFGLCQRSCGITPTPTTTVASSSPTGSNQLPTTSEPTSFPTSITSGQTANDASLSGLEKIGIFSSILFNAISIAMIVYYCWRDNHQKQDSSKSLGQRVI